MGSREIEVRMIEIMDEIVILTKEYVLLKDRTFKYDKKISQEKIHEEYLRENDYQKYKNSYDIISLYITSFLKERGIPTKSQIIYEHLVNEKRISLSYTNLQSNYLKRIHDDNNVNVERAYRGYYQYRRKSK
ncbi:hypothetical protein [Enterococcus sp. OL5]|uniref:hypothetical protein n=1 Tax=Enterococcus sp. OL5 TaxID=2590214 RepID=UPI00112CD847|nr:hypothetical protein [Enterococcus sp. OL5]TPR57383.1 hypothetical protein FJU10_09325 [Enterococcus sp. OL5]